MPASCEEMADLITELRSIGMKKLFENAEIKGNRIKRIDNFIKKSRYGHFKRFYK